jgi:hypothetical protein
VVTDETANRQSVASRSGTLAKEERYPQCGLSRLLR